MTLDSRLNELLTAYGADPKTLRTFIDLNLRPEAKYFAQAVRFTQTVDSVLGTQNSRQDWMSGQIDMNRKAQDPHFQVEKQKLGEEHKAFLKALSELLAAFSEANHGKS